MDIGVLIGSVLSFDGIAKVPGPVRNRYGVPSSGTIVMESSDHRLYFISRHGAPPSIPPHRIDHRANIEEMRSRKVSAIVSVCSTGALKASIPVPSFAVPDDYFDMSSQATFIEDRIEHPTPSLSPTVREAILSACREQGIGPKDGGVYVQSRGPRLETKAEVRALSMWGDYVGMNMAPEATLSLEASIPFGALVTIDNFANGIMERPLEFREILARARSNWAKVLPVLMSIPGHLEKKL